MPETWLYLVGVCMADDRVGFAVGNYGRVLRTLDGGATWGEIEGSNDAWHYDCETFPGGGLLVVGFDNTVEANEGVVRWSDDGLILGPRTSLFNGQEEPWLHTTMFSDGNRGVIVPSSGGLFVTASGPAQTVDWAWRFRWTAGGRGPRPRSPTDGCG